MSDESAKLIEHCPDCGGRPIVTWATGWRVCDDCELRWHEETGETLEEAVEIENKLISGPEQTIFDRLKGIFK